MLLLSQCRHFNCNYNAIQYTHIYTYIYVSILYICISTIDSLGQLTAAEAFRLIIAKRQSGAEKCVYEMSFLS